MPRRFLLAWSAFALVFSVQVSGCSLIGYYTGRALDARRPVKLRPGQPVEVIRLDPQATLAVRYADGTALTGKYVRLEARPDSEYVARYSAWRDSASFGFRQPGIGEPVQIHLAGARGLGARVRRGSFLGFAPGGVGLLQYGDTASVVRMDRIARMIDETGESTRGEELRAAAGLPVWAVAVLRQGRVERRVDLLDDAIEAIELGGPNRAYQNTFVAIGLVADAVIIVAVSLPDPAPTPPSSSCTGGTGYYTDARVAPDTLWLLPPGARRPGRGRLTPSSSGTLGSTRRWPPRRRLGRART